MEKLPFVWLAMKGNLLMLNLMVNNPFKAFSTKLNAQQVNGMTH